jgi:3-deoxy-D-manno-octulosonic-acid transferase
MNLLDALYGVALTGLAPALIYKRLRHGKYRESLPAMFGAARWVPPAIYQAPWADGCAWVHAVSVGEVNAARAILPKVRELWPNLPILLTTVTETGQAAARGLVAKAIVDACAYWPADFSWVVRSFLHRYKPQVLLLMETELWPNALRLTAAQGIPIFTINSKISPRSFRRYQKFPALLNPVFGSVSGWCAQTPEDAQRIRQLVPPTVPAPRIVVTGNIKFDLPLPSPSPQQTRELEERLALQSAHPILVVASTHRDEENLVIQGLRPALERHPNTQIILVPRHPERFSSVWDQLLALDPKFHLRRYSDGATRPASGPAIRLLDGMGLLMGAYALSTISLVGGSFVPGIGGHNILEPAALAKPIIVGPHMEGQPEMTKALLEGGGLVQVSVDKLAEQVTELLHYPRNALALGERAKMALEQNQGAADRSARALAHWLMKGASPS